MPSTLQALLVAFLAILPGALYTWSFEQHAGRFDATAVGRLQRFLGTSAFFLVFEIPVFYNLVYRKYVVTGDLDQGRALPWWVWIYPAMFVIIPVAIGKFIGQAARNRRTWTKIITGPFPAPRAWDHLFAGNDLFGFIRLRLNDETWLLGAWGRSEQLNLDSYASGYPEPQDLFISDIVESDSDGEFLTDDHGKAILTGRSLLIRWDQVTYAEFIPS
jgi:hypothetical protein